MSQGPNDISGFGLQINLIASSTFPNGVLISQFADDADPFDTPAIQLADKAMGLNGDLITWSKATPLEVTINVIPDSEDDRNLSALADANLVGKGRKSAQDVITMVKMPVDGKPTTYNNGKLTNAMPGTSVASLLQVDKLGQAGLVDAYVDDDRLVIKDRGKGLAGRTRRLTKDTGLIGIPEVDEKGVKVKMLMDPFTGIGTTLEIESELNAAANGKFTVYKMKDNAATRNTQFYIEAEALRPGLGGMPL